MSSPHIEFERDSQEIADRCDRIAAQLTAGEITESEFDAEAARILGADYDPDMCVAGVNAYVICDCSACVAEMSVLS